PRYATTSPAATPLTISTFSADERPTTTSCRCALLSLSMIITNTSSSSCTTAAAGMMIAFGWDSAMSGTCTCVPGVNVVGFSNVKGTAGIVGAVSTWGGLVRNLIGSPSPDGPITKPV